MGVGCRRRARRAHAIGVRQAIVMRQAHRGAPRRRPERHRLVPRRAAVHGDHYPGRTTSERRPPCGSAPLLSEFGARGGSVSAMGEGTAPPCRSLWLGPPFVV